MDWVALILGLLSLALLGLLLYWQLVIAEGTYLGSRIVILLYDLSARVYERIKRYDAGDEQWFLGLPLARALAPIPASLVLDVATGTGRLPRALLRQPAFDGRVIGLDLSRRMLREAGRPAPSLRRRHLRWCDLPGGPGVHPQPAGGGGGTGARPAARRSAPGDQSRRA
jgi:SAM-dependent methyltransferase